MHHSAILERKLDYVGKRFGLPGVLYSITVLIDGNVNSTYRLEYHLADGTVAHYVAQRINPYVFHRPVEMMRNIDLVTTHIQKKNKTGNSYLHFHRTAAGANFFMDEEDGAYWRVTDFIPALSQVMDGDLTLLRNAGRAFGEFQMQLSDFDASLLVETIPDFHDTGKRLDTFFRHVLEDPCGRASEISAEIAYLRSVSELASQMTAMLKAGELPLRVTHNDTKINNVLFDKETREPLTVIDLDTVMPGLAMHDFGDAVRFAASTAAEDEPDLSKVSLDLTKYRAFAEGFISEVSHALTERELETMALGALTITIELAARFLDDYLLGDKYFKVNYPGHNLVRGRCQLHLAKDMQAKFEEMCAIVKEVAKD